MRHGSTVSVGCEWQRNRKRQVVVLGSVPLLAAGGRKNPRELEVRQATKGRERGCGAWVPSREGGITYLRPRSNQDSTVPRVPAGGRSRGGGSWEQYGDKNNVLSHVGPKGGGELNTLLLEFE